MSHRPTFFFVVTSIAEATSLLAFAIILQSGSVMAADEPQNKGGDWSITLTRRGGLSGGVDKIEIKVKDERGRGKRSLTPEEGDPTTTEAMIPRPALDSLSTTMEKVKAWELPDFDKPALDSPDYTIRLEHAGRSRTIKVRGAGNSRDHLKLILAIEQCFEKGVAR